MADKFYGIDRGDAYIDVVTQGTSPAKDVEITVDDAVGLTKEEILRQIDVMKAFILEEASFG